MSDDNIIEISLDNKPNLAKLKEKDIVAFREIMSTMMSIAEDAADRSRAFPWYAVPGMFNENLTFANTAPAVMKAFFSADQLNPDNFTVLGMSIHPMSLFKKVKMGENISYSEWRKHFDMPEHANVTPEAVTAILRKLLYYARYINISDFGQALMSNQLEVHKAIPLLNAERLPLVPAIRHQKEVFGDLYAGKFWDEIGAFYGGDYEEVPNDCPACHLDTLEIIQDYHVCSHCNLGVKVIVPED